MALNKTLLKTIVLARLSEFEVDEVILDNIISALSNKTTFEASVTFVVDAYTREHRMSKNVEIKSLVPKINFTNTWK